MTGGAATDIIILPLLSRSFEQSNEGHNVYEREEAASKL
jgi:hypothetical protein